MKKSQGDLLDQTNITSGDLASNLTSNGITVAAVPQVNIIPEREWPQPSTMITILELAIRQNVNPETLARLLEVKRDWERAEAEKAFVKARNAFKANPPVLEKVKRVDFESKSGSHTSYQFAPLDYIVSTVSAALAKHDLSFHWDIDQTEDAKIGVTCVLEHSQGHADRVRLAAFPLDDPRMNLLQRTEGAITVLQRVTLLCVTGLAPRETLFGPSPAPLRQPAPPPAAPAPVRRSLTNLLERMEWLKNAKDEEELRRLYNDAVIAAREVNDDNALKALETAKNLKKAEFQKLKKTEEPF